MVKDEPAEEFHFCDHCDFSSNKESEYQEHMKIRHIDQLSDDAESKKRSHEDDNPTPSKRAKTEEYVEKMRDKLRDLQDSPEKTNKGDQDEDQEVEGPYVSKLMDKLRDLDDSDEEDADDPGDSHQDISSDLIEPFKNRSISILNLDRSRLSETLINNLEQRKYFLDNPDTLSMLEEERMSVSMFSGDPGLGPGWRVRYYSVRGKGGRVSREFLSPDHVRLGTPEAVIEYLQCSQTT